MKSQDVISTLGMLAACGSLYVSGSMVYGNIEEFWVRTWKRLEHPETVVGNSFFWEIIDVIGVVSLSLAPMMVACFLMGIIANVAQIKLLFTTEPLKPSLKKINPISGFKQIFSMKSIVELIKQLAKLAIVGWICYSAINGEIEKFRLAPSWDLMQTVGLVGELTLRIIKNVLLGMVVIMGLDYVFQKKQFGKQMKMSHKDLKDEYKETEGNPHIKAKIRQKMAQGAQGGMMQEVPNSNAVVTNPTHLAVAIKYNKEDCPVPTVVAKGERMIAQAIKLKAEDHEVPVIENVELARALFGACEVGQAIPTELYKAVAEILAYVQKLKKKKEMRRRAGGGGRGRR